MTTIADILPVLGLRITAGPLELRGITKRFPGVLANDHIDLDVRAGEILALLGENGAGKSTLMSILSGLYQADEGDTFVRGKLVNIRSPRQASEAGIGMVYQHFMLIETHTVAENITLGLREPRFVLNIRQTENEIERLALNGGDVLITKDSETPDDIAKPAFVRTVSTKVICGYHLAHIRHLLECVQLLDVLNLYI